MKFKPGGCSSKLLNEFLGNAANQNVRSADVYSYYLSDFEEYVESVLKTSVDKLIITLQKKPEDVYSVIS